MTQTLWGLSVGDIWRSSWYGTARRYRTLAIREDDPKQWSWPLASSERRATAHVAVQILAEPNHPAERGQRVIAECDGDPPMEIGGYDHDRGGWLLAPITILERADIQLDLFGGGS